MAVCPLILNFLHISSQKWLVFANYFSLPNFLPQLANFLHGYIRHIRDIFQLWLGGGGSPMWSDCNGGQATDWTIIISRRELERQRRGLRLI